MPSHAKNKVLDLKFTSNLLENFKLKTTVKLFRY